MTHRWHALPVRVISRWSWAIRGMDRLGWLTRGSSFAYGIVLGGIVFGCAGGPDPIIIYETPREVVSVRFDARAGTGHDHPASVDATQLAVILQALRVTPRDTWGLGGLFGKGETAPAFTPSEAELLAPHLSGALQKASPRDVATFYLLSADSRLGKLVTSGGLFVRRGHLYVILANFRTPPSAGPYEGMAYELDNRDEPLQPIARYRFTVSFAIREAELQTPEVRRTGEYQGYVDEMKVVIIDLGRVPADLLRGKDRPPR